MPDTKSQSDKESTKRQPPRRPLPARELALSRRLAGVAIRLGLTPNAISIAGMASGLLAGAALAATNHVAAAWPLWLAAALLAELRLLANMLDGMVALGAGRESALGELFNELPDRISDAAILIGLGYAAGSDPVLGWAAALLAVGTAYVRAAAALAGAPHDFSGPMAKPLRMHVVAGLGMVGAVLPTWVSDPLAEPSWSSPVAITLLILIVGTFVTTVRRVTNAIRYLRDAR